MQARSRASGRLFAATVDTKSKPIQGTHHKPQRPKILGDQMPNSARTLIFTLRNSGNGTQVGALCSLPKLLIGEATLPRERVTRQHSLVLSASRNLVRSSRVFLSA
jgi:hypothetical protein